MADESNHLLDAAQALDAKIPEKAMNPEHVAKDSLDMVPEDATEDAAEALRERRLPSGEVPASPEA